MTSVARGRTIGTSSRKLRLVNHAPCREPGSGLRLSPRDSYSRRRPARWFTFPKILCRIWSFLAPLREGRTTLRAVLQRGTRFP